MVLAHSIRRRASKPVSITFLQIDQLPIERRGLTEFTYSRYLVPYLCDFEGEALFLDADMLCLGDITEIERLCHGMNAPVAMVTEGVEQFEWPSLMYFRCSECKTLTPEYLETGKPQAFREWTPGIASLPKEWNHIVPYSGINPDAKLVHFTQGIPVWPETQSCEFAEAWGDEYLHMSSTCTFNELMGSSVHVGRMSGQN